MLTESFFRIGATHKVCQDYALTGKNWGIISDGCSSSPDTNVGSMVAARALDFCLRYYYDKQDHKSLFMLTADRMEMSANVLQIPTNSLDATLGFVYADEASCTGVLYGDGNFIVRYENGITLVVNVEFTENYPDYLSYSLDERRAAVLANVANNNKVITKIFYDKNFNQIVKDSAVSSEKIVVENFLDSDVDSKVVFACVTSDGLDTFEYQRNSTWVPVPQADILAELLNFKMLSAGFLERRINLFQKFLIKNNIRHADDFSMAVVVL